MLNVYKISLREDHRNDNPFVFHYLSYFNLHILSITDGYDKIMIN